MVERRGGGEERGGGPGQARPQPALEGCRGRGAPGGVEAGEGAAQGQRDGAGEVVGDVRLPAVRHHDRAAEGLQFAEQVGQRHEVEMARLAVRDPPLAEQRAERAVRVGDLDEEVTAGAEHLQGGAQFLAGVGGVLQMVEHAHDVVPAAQPLGDPRVGEPADVGLLHPPGGARLLDAP